MEKTFNTDFTPEGYLEEAIYERNCADIIELLVADYKLERPDILASREFFDLPITTAMLVVSMAAGSKNLQASLDYLKNNYPDSEVPFLIEEAMAEDTPPTEDDHLLMTAIMEEQNDAKICRLINDGHMFTHFAPVLFTAFPKLQKHTVVTILHSGIHYSLCPLVLNFLVAECFKMDSLKKLGYKTLLMYANLYVHILQKAITPADDELIAEDWYPCGNTIEEGFDPANPCFSYSYYLDPKRRYKPAPRPEEYEEPDQDI